jgi:hypothetical protein
MTDGPGFHLKKVCILYILVMTAGSVFTARSVEASIQVVQVQAQAITLCKNAFLGRAS